jgi:MoaA/NifB/PqqE/SkfB family radical SAM enzyme
MERLTQWRGANPPGPWTISLYPTYRCNIQCRLCWKRAFPEPLKPNEELPDERILRLVDEAADLGVRDWMIGGGGELMLRNELILDMCEKIRARNMNGLIQTNGTKFKQEELERLVDMQWKTISVSIDGPTAEINDGIRIEKNFDRAVDTIQRLQAIKKIRESEYPRVNIISVITNRNYDKLKMMVDLAKTLNISPGNLAAVELIVYGENDRQFELSAEQKAALPGLLLEAIEYARERGVVNDYTGYLNGMGQGESPLHAIDLFTQPSHVLSSSAMCFEPFSHMVIMPQGDTGPCCTFDDKDCDNIWNSSLRDVWLGPYLQSVRKRILEGTPPAYCTSCMITRIEENRRTQIKLETIERRVIRDESVTPARLVAKAANSLRHYGLTGSVRRAGEWMGIKLRRT